MSRGRGYPRRWHRLIYLVHHVPIIVSSWNFQELLPWTEVMSMQKVKVRIRKRLSWERSKVKVTGVNTQLSRFRTLTPVWIHIWQWNHAHSWKQHRRGTLLFFKVIRQISRSHGSKNRQIWPRLGVSGLYLQFEFTNGYKIIHKAWSSVEEVPYCFSGSSVKFLGHTAQKIVYFDPNGAFPDFNLSLNFNDGIEMMHKA